MSKEAQNWDKWLPYAVLAYRTTPDTVTGYSTHYLVYGQELRLPIEDDLRVVIRKSNPGNYNEHVINLAKRLKQVSEIVRQENRKEQAHSKKYCDKQTQVREFKVGDLVYMKDLVAKQRPKRKFADKWEGPYEVIETLSELTYRVRMNNGHIVTTHINRLKGCKSKPIESTKIIDKPQLNKPNKLRDRVTLNHEFFRVGIKL